MSDSILEETQELSPALVVAGPQRRVGFYLRWAGIIVGLIVVVMFARSLLQSRTQQVTPLYKTEAVTRGDLFVTVSATGNLKPLTTVEVGSELSGTVDSVLVDTNDRVKKGQVLLRLDTTKLQAAINQSKAALVAAEARLRQSSATVKEAAANLERLREVSRLSGGKVPSKSEMQTAEATLERALADEANARAAVSQSHAALTTDETNLSKASLRSPINGMVLSRSVEPGQTVAAGLQVTTLFTLAEDLTEMKLQVDVDEADVGSVKAGQTATFTVDAYPTRKYEANVTRVAYGSQTKDNVVSYPTLLTVKNKDLSLRPGMTATAEINTISRENALLIPNAALRFTPSAAPAEAKQDGGGVLGKLLPHPPRGPEKQVKAQAVAGGTQTVWVLRDGKPAPVHVTVGATDGRFTEVVSGEINESTQLITDTVAPAK